jgi:hypothetical protein
MTRDSLAARQASLGYHTAPKSNTKILVYEFNDPFDSCTQVVRLTLDSTRVGALFTEIQQVSLSRRLTECKFDDQSRCITRQAGALPDHRLKQSEPGD